ncbi:MAG: hypothetical protein KAI94_10370, partial [Anaerolineales bacterium]|nr:hypothetical protein [Anaerolineales bacterium]
DLLDKGGNMDETVVREGRVITERPKVITPSYLFNLEGFSKHARKYLELLAEKYGPNAPGIFYSYKNEPKDTSIVSSPMKTVVDRINKEIDSNGDPLSTIIKGVDEMWDVSVMKFIYEVTENSVSHHVNEMGSRGYFNTDRAGVPQGARQRIEEMFAMVKSGELEPPDLKIEMDRWGLFREYEDRFLSLFR